MANVFELDKNLIETEFDAKDNNYKIPSVAYVESVIKQLEDFTAFLAYTSGQVYSQVDYDRNVTTEKFSVETTDSTTEEDFNHRTLSDAQIDIFKAKASKLDLVTAISALRTELKTYYADQFSRILNDSNALTKLKDMSYLIKEDDSLASLTNALASKATEEELKDHIEDSVHLTNADRNALNQLVKIITLGGFDWNAEDGSINAIKNKPSKLPADGGNAATIGGCKVEDIANHQLEEYIFGCYGEKYPEIACDAVVSSEYETNTKVIIDTINNNRRGLYSFKSGIYTFEDFDIKTGTNRRIIIRGSGIVNTVFEANSIKLDKGVELRDLTIKHASIYIGSNCVLDNVQFVDCDIYFKIATESTMRDCVLDACRFRIDGAFVNSIITGNRFISTYIPQVYYNNNLISNNLTY